MPTTYYTLLTLAGKAKIANAVALGTAVSISQMAIGDGNGNPTTPSEGQTALVREVYRGSLTRLSIDPNNANYIIAELAVPSNVGGWTAREVGVYDSDGNLFCISNFAATYKPQITEGTMRDLVIRVVMEVANSSVVNLLVDPNVVIASRAWVIDNYGLANLLPGGLTNQIATKASNADGDIHWQDAGSFTYLVNAIIEAQILAADQLIIECNQVGTQGLALYIEGVRSFNFTTNSATRITLGQSYPQGTKIWMCQNDPLGEIVDSSIHRTGGGTVAEELDGIDEKLLNVSNLQNYGLNLDAYVTPGMFIVSDALNGPLNTSTGLRMYKEVSLFVFGNCQILCGRLSPSSLLITDNLLWIRNRSWASFSNSWACSPQIINGAFNIPGIMFASDSGTAFNVPVTTSKDHISHGAISAPKIINDSNYTYDPDDPYELYIFTGLTNDRIFTIPRASATGRKFKVVCLSDYHNLYLKTTGVQTTWIGATVSGFIESIILTGVKSSHFIQDVGTDHYSIN